MIRLMLERVLGRKIQLIALALLAVAGNASLAETVQPMSLSDRIARADDVSHARVSKVTSEWRGGKIFTQIHFERLAQAMGDQKSSSELVVTLLGGQAVHPVLKVPVIQQVAGFVRFTPGDEAVLFTRQTVSSERQLVGGRSGVVRVSQLASRNEKTVDAAAQQLVASRAAEVAGVQKAGGRRAVVIKPRPFSVDDYLGHVSKLVAEQRKQTTSAGTQP